MGSLIMNEPDSWMVNELDKTARHIIHPGPTFNCRMPIFADAGDIKAAEDLKKAGLQLEREPLFAVLASSRYRFMASDFSRSAAPARLRVCAKRKLAR
jgi:hypothetical protein